VHLLSILTQPQPSLDALQAAAAFVASVAPATCARARSVLLIVVAVLQRL